MKLYPPKIDRSKPYDLVCFGYNSVDYLCLVERYPGIGEKVQMLELERQGGGQCATASVAAKRLGLERVLYVGKFGSDEHGTFSRRSIEQEGVEVIGRVAEGARNQIAVIMVDDRSGERTITYIRDEGLDIEAGEFDADIFARGKLLLIDAHNLSATIEAARVARSHGIPVVVDAERVLDRTGELVELCWAVIGDEGFCHRFTQIADEKQALIELSAGCRIAGKTLGPRGSLVFDGERFIRTPALKVKATDTTGAGDVFHAAFCVGVLMGLGIEETLALSNAAAGIKCTKLGGRRGIPSLQEALDASKELLERTEVFYP